MINRRKDRRWVRWIGNVLSFLGIVFVGITLYQQSSSLDYGELGGIFLLALLSAVFGWQFVNASIGTGWLFSLKVLNCDIGFGSSLEFTFKTQIAKYIPGNVFHLVGRTVLLRQDKGSSYISFVSLILESHILIVQGVVVWLIYRYLNVDFYIVLLFPPICAFILSVAGLLLSSRIRLLGFVFVRQSGWALKLAASCIFYYFIFFIQTSLFLLLLKGIGAEEQIGFWEAFNLLTISWVAGYLIIGSPGGMGIREGIFGLLVSEFDSGSTLLFALVLLRFCSVIGDTFSFLISFLWKSNEYK